MSDASHDSGWSAYGRLGGLGALLKADLKYGCPKLDNHFNRTVQAVETILCRTVLKVYTCKEDLQGL